MKRIGKQAICKNIIYMVVTAFISAFISCGKDDDMGMKVPSINKQEYILSSNTSVNDSLYEIYKNSYRLFKLGIINAKNDKEELCYINLSKQEQNVIADEAGNKLGEIKYGKNDVLEINIYNFCTLKRKMDSEKGKMYIITPFTEKRNDIYITLSILLDKGIGRVVEIH